jgi:GT2 family glycosyltransferase
MSAPLLSIVMSYFNRPLQLKRTIISILKSSLYKDIELIIVDDDSDSNLRAKNFCFPPQLKVSVIDISTSERTWNNPCVPFNKGFEQAKGDIVIIQNPEVMHIGDVIEYALKYSTNKNYLSFCCAGIMDKGFSDSQFSTLLSSTVSDSFKVTNQHKNQWYNHPEVRPVGYHFCSAIKRRNLITLGGFDQRFANGFCYDDNEFVTRIKRMGLQLQFVPVNDCYTIHQHHENTKIKRFPAAGPLFDRNKKLFQNIVLKEKSWIANGGTYGI